MAADPSMTILTRGRPRTGTLPLPKGCLIDLTAASSLQILPAGSHILLSTSGPFITVAIRVHVLHGGVFLDIWNGLLLDSRIVGKAQAHPYSGPGLTQLTPGKGIPRLMLESALKCIRSHSTCFSTFRHAKPVT